VATIDKIRARWAEIAATKWRAVPQCDGSNQKSIVGQGTISGRVVMGANGEPQMFRFAERVEPSVADAIASAPADVATLLAALDEARANEATWRRTCGQLRAQAKAVSGALCDASDVQTGDYAAAIRELTKQRNAARDDVRTLLAALDEARATARREALEEAAGVCGWVYSDSTDRAEMELRERRYVDTGIWRNRAEGARQCRDTIRALATREKGGG
jgi:hypothetical protein